MLNKMKSTMRNLKMQMGILCSALRIRRQAKDFNEYVINLNNIKTIDIMGNTINIKIDNDAVKVTGFRFAIAHTPAVCGAAIYNVVLEDSTNELGITDFLVQHEVGHFVNEIFTTNVTVLNNTRRIENEFAADLYAAQQIGFDEAIEALYIISQQKNIDTLEINSRIQYLVMCKSLMNK
mgnify:FL=1